MPPCRQARKGVFDPVSSYLRYAACVVVPELLGIPKDSKKWSSENTKIPRTSKPFSDYLKLSNIDFTYTPENSGICKGMNLAAKKSKFDYILISHDDFYYCPEWDIHFSDEIKTMNHKNFFLQLAIISLISILILFFLNKLPWQEWWQQVC